MRTSSFSRNSVAYIALLISVSCLSLLIFSLLRLPDVPTASVMPRKLNLVSRDYVIGKFGEIMVQMLPDDLAFTIFMPSEKAFKRDLRLSLNQSLVIGENYNDTYAVLSRILGFSVVPRTIVSSSVPNEEEISYDSLSGFGLFIWKDLNGRLIVNGVRSERVDMKRGKIVLHIMDGVIMDAEFQQSIWLDFDEDD